MTRQKNKLKGSRSTAYLWFEYILGRRDISFIVSLSLERTLEKVQKTIPRCRDQWFPEGVSITLLQRSDDDTYEIELSAARRYGGRVVAARGYLKRWQSDSTYISLIIRPFFGGYAFFIGWMLVMVAILTVFWFIWLFTSLVVYSFYWLWARDGADDIEKVLKSGLQHGT